MSHIGHSIIGDQTYGQNSRKMQQNLSSEQNATLLNFNRQALHSSSIGFVHPKSKQPMYFESELPQDIQALISILNS
jgi:23S rRNA pseudouridine1911/1915/1917 synthase